MASARATSKTGPTKDRQPTKNAWQPLAKGDLIDIIAPAFRTADQSVVRAEEYLKSRGYRVRVPSDIFGTDVLCAQTDENRLKQLKAALLAKDSKAVWCLRGGYGALRLIPELMKLKAPSKSKLFVGLSDITSLHMFMNQYWKWPTIHGPMADKLASGKLPAEFVEEILRMVEGVDQKITFSSLTPLNDAAMKKKTIRGEVIGGNLMTVSSHLGTKLKWNTKSKILFFEEIGEHDYRIDRIFEQLRQAGMIDHAAAVVLGDFTDCGVKDKTDKIWPVIQRFADSIKVPMLRGVQTGHDPVARALPFGAPSELHLGSDAKLICSTGVALK